MIGINMHVISDPSSGFKYIVTSSPDSNSIYSYKNLLFKNNVTTVLRLCDQCTYDEEYLSTFNINVIHMPLKDGDVPDVETIKQWTEIISNASNGIAVHCKAGLGRAPLFVCIGLILVCNMETFEAIDLVRKHIKGSLNSKQIDFLCNTLQNKKKKNHGCIIM